MLPPPGRHFSSPSSPMLGTPEKALIATCSGGMRRRLLVRDVSRLAALPEHVAHALDLAARSPPRSVHRRRPTRSRRRGRGCSRKCRRPRPRSSACRRSPGIPGSRLPSRTDRGRWTTRNNVGTKFDSFSGRQSSMIVLQIVIVRKREVERAHRRRPRQQPHAHAGDDAEIRLREQPVEDRAEAVFRRVPVDQLLGRARRRRCAAPRRCRARFPVPQDNPK